MKTGSNLIERTLEKIPANNVYIPVNRQNEISALSSTCPCQVELTTSTNMMKFPKPRHLTINEYPDLLEDQPTILQNLVQKCIKPKEHSDENEYIIATIRYIKKKEDDTSRRLRLYSTNVGQKLFFVAMTLPPSTRLIKCLIDTGASNSLLHNDIATELSLSVKPTNMKIATATGTSSDIILGTSHLKFRLSSNKNQPADFCSNFIVTKKLNGMDCILGAEFLLDESKVESISASWLRVLIHGKKMTIPVFAEDPPLSANTALINTSDTPTTDDGNHCEVEEHLLPFVPENEISIASNYNHNITAEFENETLPPSEQFFDNTYELKFESLEKKISIEDADYSDCPPEHIGPLKAMLKNYDDRFSKSKLDLETTTLYEAALPTLPGRIVTQKVRRLPPHKYNFAMQAIKQLQESGVVRESDSPWRSNVVLVPKPASSDEERENTNASRLTGEQNHSALYRICLDFRELNTCLEFPQQTSFTTADEIIFTLKNKIVVSMDISSAFFIIPIKEEDRYKTAFWVNNSSFEFNVAVMGLKSSPYHLNKFIETAFNAETFNEIKGKLPESEKLHAPASFKEVFISYFDDFFVYADTHQKCIIALKMVLEAARRAGIKFSAEKTKFLTTKIKVLGYSYDTMSLNLCMNKNKASAFENMKKPSSLYELHSRLASFQYQQQFLPFIKHILYPLNFLLRKKAFRWTEVEERAWKTAIELTKLNIQLTVPEPTDTLVLTTDASKVAAAAILFRVNNDRLEIVSATSKYFSTADLGKSSYFLEAIALAYGIKSFAPYLLNCQGKIIIYTDAKALIYAKRMSTHSILLNNTLTYLTNFVSIANVDLYHLPGSVNVLADVLSRAIADNLNNKMPKEHPISKQWAKVLPPIPSKFGVDHDTLYKFLITPLQPEPQDLFDRSLRRLMEPKSIHTVYKESQTMTPEEKYHSAQTLLKQWLSEYATKYKDENVHSVPVYSAKLQLDLEFQKACMEKIQQILDKYYDDIKGTPVFKSLQKNLEEVSKNYLLCAKSPITEQLLGKLKASQKKLIAESQILSENTVLAYAEEQIKETYINAIKAKMKKATQPVVHFSLHKTANILPKICDDSNGLDIPLQEDVHFEPYELKKVNLGIKFQIPKNHCALLLNKSSARTKYHVNVQLGLIDIGYHDFIVAVIQNMTPNPLTLERGIAVAQLLLLPSKIPTFCDKWPLSNSKRGSFGSTGQTFSENTNTNYLVTLSEIESEQDKQHRHETVQFSTVHQRAPVSPLHAIENELNPTVVTVDNISVHLLGDPVENTQTIYDLRRFENKLIGRFSPNMYKKLPMYQSVILPAEHSAPKPPTEEEELFAEADKTLFPKHYQVPITPDDLSHLLAADLLQNKKLSLESLIYLQNMDPHISDIKHRMLDTGKFKNFILKKNIVCKRSPDNDQSTTAIYLPSVLLYPTVVYIHKFFFHPSTSQTIKEFSLHYYHPQSRAAVKKVCAACLTCATTRNPEYRMIPVGKERSIVPTCPREAISMDILYLPTSTEGHTHALIISDLYSMYLTLYPLKGKTSSAVAKALNSYISTSGIPKIIYSDNDPSFRGETEVLLATYHIQHATSYPYVQRANTVEAQVRKVKNAARAAISENPIMSHRNWHQLYPLVIIRLNTLISKYGASRELIHFQNVLHTHIPLITDIKFDAELEAELNVTARKLKSKIEKFLKNKHKSKEYYKKGLTRPYLLHELVMRKIYTPESPLHPTFAGPFRIIELHPQGASIKNTRTGEIFSAHYMNLRKITPDEFITLLPENFDSEILKYMGTFRYNKTHQPDPAVLNKLDPEILNADNISDNKHNDQKSEKIVIPPGVDSMKLRSGRIIRINPNSLPAKIVPQAAAAYFTRIHKSCATWHPHVISCLTRSLITPRTAYADMEQTYTDGCYVFGTTIGMHHPENYFKRAYNSSFQSSLPGYLVIDLDNEEQIGQTVKFGKVVVKFYESE